MDDVLGLPSRLSAAVTGMHSGWMRQKTAYAIDGSSARIHHYNYEIPHQSFGHYALKSNEAYSRPDKTARRSRSIFYEQRCAGSVVSEADNDDDY
jgi:hypothetical protein